MRNLSILMSWKINYINNHSMVLMLIYRRKLLCVWNYLWYVFLCFDQIFRHLFKYFKDYNSRTSCSLITFKMHFFFNESLCCNVLTFTHKETTNCRHLTEAGAQWGIINLMIHNFKDNIFLHPVYYSYLSDDGLIF